jgi:hypothetical protein
MNIKLSTGFDTQRFMKDIAFHLRRLRQCYSATSDLALYGSPHQRLVSNHGTIDLTGFADT